MPCVYNVVPDLSQCLTGTTLCLTSPNRQRGQFSTTVVDPSRRYRTWRVTGTSESPESQVFHPLHTCAGTRRVPHRGVVMSHAPARYHTRTRPGDGRATISTERWLGAVLARCVGVRRPCTCPVSDCRSLSATSGNSESLTYRRVLPLLREGLPTPAGLRNARR